MKNYNWLPNQSGTFSNRVNFHNSETEEKLFVLEHAETERDVRIDITSLIKSAPELLRWCIKMRDILIEVDDFN